MYSAGCRNLYLPQEIEKLTSIIAKPRLFIRDFKYGPRDWRPIIIRSPSCVSDGAMTPGTVVYQRLYGLRGGKTRNLERLRYVVVDYRFENLSGMAAFQSLRDTQYNPDRR